MEYCTVQGCWNIISVVLEVERIARGVSQCRAVGSGSILQQRETQEVETQEAETQEAETQD